VTGGDGATSGQRGAPGPAARRRRQLVIACAVLLCAATGVGLIVYGQRVPNSQPAPLPDHQFALDPAAAPDPVAGPMPTLASPTDTATGASRATGAVVVGAAGPTGSSSAGSVTAGTGPWHAADPDPAKRQQAPQVPVVDQHLIIPAIGVDAPVQTTDRVAGSLVLPDDVSTVTEWSGSSAINADHGTVLIAGHIDNVHQGMGALYFMHTLNPGDAIYLVVNGTVTRWKVTALQTVGKLALPQDVWSGDQGPRLLKLVTCGGAVHHGSYDDNVIVTAVPF
jgi:sortase (surface protein transpeptidase)